MTHARELHIERVCCNSRQCVMNIICRILIYFPDETEGEMHILR